MFILLHEGQAQRGDNTQTHDRPPSLDDLLVGDGAARVPSQMSQSIEAVEGEGEDEEGLESDLCEDRKRGKARGERGGFQVPAEER